MYVEEWTQIEKHITYYVEIILLLYFHKHKYHGRAILKRPRARGLKHEYTRKRVDEVSCTQTQTAHKIIVLTNDRLEKYNNARKEENVLPRDEPTLHEINKITDAGNDHGVKHRNKTKVPGTVPLNNTNEKITRCERVIVSVTKTNCVKDCCIHCA